MVLNWCGGTLIWKNRPICFIFLGSWGSVPTRSTKTPTFKGIFPSQSKLDEQNFPVDQLPFESYFEVLLTFVRSQT